MRERRGRRHERAFERTYRRHVGDVYRYALGVLGDSFAAEDVTRTTFLHAFRAFRHHRGPRPSLNSILAVAHGVCRVRDGSRRHEESDSPTEDEVATAAGLRRTLGRLSYDQRAILVMREVDSRSYAEIAEILAVSVSDVEALIFRARHELRKDLERSLTCQKAELALSRQLDDRVSRKEKRLLRAHLDSCEHCEAAARCQEKQRTALRALAATPLPATLESLSGAQVSASCGVSLVSAPHGRVPPLSLSAAQEAGGARLAD
jgi:RNA polymerase sigma-70 factor, ECF subfamily